MNTEAGDKRRLIGNTVATGVAQFASLALAFVLAPLLIREFGVREYGLYVLVLSIGTFATLLDFGMGAALEKLLAEHLASRRTHEAGQLFSTVLLAYTGIGVLAMLLYAVLAWRAGHLFHIAPSEVRLLRDLLLVSGAIALATWPLSTGLRVLGGLQRYADAARVALGVTVTSALAAAYVLATHRSPVTLAALMGGATVLGGIANLVVALARLRSAGVKPAAPARTALAKVLDFSWAVFVLQLAVQLIYHHTDRLLLGLFLGAVAVTYYEGPARLVALVVQLVGLSNSALMPFASQLDATGRSGTLSALLLRGSRYVTAFIAPIATMIVVLARPLLTTWLGPEFAVAVVPTMLLVGVQIVLASATVGHTLVVGTGKLKGRLPYIIFQTLANVALSVVLVQRLGLLGVVLGTVLTSLADYPLHLRYLSKHLGLRYRDFWREVVLPVYPLLALPVALGAAAQVAGFTSTLIGTAATLVAGVAAYWAAFAFVGLAPQERAGLLAVARTMWARGATARGSDALPPAATPLRVAIDGRPLQPGFRKHAGRGIGVYARELVRALARRDDLALTLWFEPALPVPDGVVPPGVARRHYRPLRLPMRDRLASQITVPAAARGGADVFHVLAHGDAPSLPPACTVITVHDLILEVMAHHYPGNGSLRFRFARACERSAIRRAPMLVADSAATRDDLVRRHGVAPSRVHVAPLGVDACFRPPEPAAVEAFRAHHGLAAPFVLYVGGVDARKNIGLLLEAFALVRGGRAGPLELVLAGHVKGAAEYPALEARACELGIARSLRVLEFVPGEELPVLLAAARVFAFPSLYEGFGLPPLEAMACGTPVVSTDGGSLAEVLADAALVASATDPADFAAKLVTALDDEPLRAHLRARGLARAAMFTWDLTAEATVGAYRALVAARGARS